MKPYLLVLLIALVSAANSEEGDKNAEELISEKSDGSIVQSIHDSLGLAVNPYVSGVAGVKLQYYPAAAKKPLYQAAANYPAVVGAPLYQAAAKLPNYPAAQLYQAAAKPPKYPTVIAAPLYQADAKLTNYPTVVAAPLYQAAAKLPKYPAVVAAPLYQAAAKPPKYPAVIAAPLYQADAKLTNYPTVVAAPLYQAAAKLPYYPAVIPKPYQQANYLDGLPTTEMELPEAEETLHANHEETLPENSDAPGDNPAERNTSGQSEKTITENSGCEEKF